MPASLDIVRLPELPLDKTSRTFAEEIANLPGVRKVRLMPDTFTKDKYLDLDYKITIPSSSSIVTDEDVLYPQFRSRGINCGMMSVALPYTNESITREDIEAIFAALTMHPLYYALYRARLPFWRDAHDLTSDEFMSVLSGDYETILDRYEVEAPHQIWSDFGDSVFRVDIKAKKHLLNQQWLTRRTVRSRHRFGRDFGGNHYFELQAVDRDIPELGVQKNQVIATMHTGCQGIEALVHPQLAKEYFYQKSYRSTKKGEDMYEAFFVAQSMLLHYGTVYRLATLARINRVLKARVGQTACVMYDKSHNFVRKETLVDKEVLVYRHNAERITPGGYALVSGLATVPSFIVKGGTKTKMYNHSIDHGLGHVLTASDMQPSITGQTVHQARINKGVPFFGHEVKERSLNENNMTRAYFEEVAEREWAYVAGVLRPIANLKYT